MQRSTSFLLIGLFLALTVLAPAAAQGDMASAGDAACSSWQATYFDDTRGYAAAPVVERQDARIDFDWGYGAPAAGMSANHFSVRWQCTRHFEAGTYRFTTTSDDGLRLYVDGQPVVDAWFDHPARTFTSEIALAEGTHEVVVTYYENTGVAVAKASWARASIPPGEWHAEYFDNRWLGGAPVLTRSDKFIDFDWGYGSPDPTIPSNDFGVSWTRTVDFEPGLYRFTTTTDDGVRLWAGEHMVIDQWRDQWAQSHSGTAYLSGETVVHMETYEHTGVAVARLRWTRVDDAPPGEVIVDNGDPGFEKGGAATAWRAAAGGYGGDLLWTWNNRRVRSGYNWARWYPDLAPGRYEILVHVPEGYSTTAQARYWVSHRNGYSLRRVDQSANGGRWVSLGTYGFRGSRQDYVSLADVTFEPYLSRLIAFDAVKWVAR
ncbi:MAG: PA14 domain-containing protein [Anaerolineae bacterium]|jgi:hypothetical protein